MAHLYLALSLPRAHYVLEHQHTAWGWGLAAAGSQVLGAEQRCRPTSGADLMHTVHRSTQPGLRQEYFTQIFDSTGWTDVGVIP